MFGISLDSFRPYLSRVVSAAIGGLAASVQKKYGFEVDPGTQATISTAIVVGVYGVAHKVVDKYINPADSASKHLAVEGKAQVAALKVGI